MDGGERQWRSKLIVVGEGGVGKTSLLRKLRNEDFDPDEDTTHGIEIRSLELKHVTEDVNMTLHAWDFGGQEIYHATHQFFLTNRSLFLLVWNARLGYEQGRLYYWLDTIKALAPDAPIILVVTHVDQRSADIPLADIRLKYPRILAQVEISNLTGYGIEKLREIIQHETAQLPLMGEIWPSSWLKATKTIREHPFLYITSHEFWQIMNAHNVTGDNQRVLATWLHELGDILFFQDDDELNNTVILKPQWISQRISDVLTNNEVIGSLGIFTRTHMNKLWHDIEPTMRERLLRLMEKFDLSYRIPDDPASRSLIVERLSLDEPYYQKRWREIQDTGNCKEITMKFVLNSTMPAGIPTWFIARAHRFTTHTHWRYGALFSDQDQQHLALIRAYPHQRYIQLSVRGPYPYNFFALLRDGFELTLSRFPGLEFKRMVPCPGHNENTCEHEFDYANLERALTKHTPVMEIQCPVSFENVSVPGMLLGLHYKVTQNVIIDRIDKLEESSAQQYSSIKDELNEILALSQREFTNMYHRDQALNESHCPHVFTLIQLKDSRNKGLLKRLPKKNFFGDELQLQLFCQAPGQWHPTIDGGNYIITDPAEWLDTIAFHLKRLVKVLKFVTPIVGPWLGHFNSDYAEMLKSEIELTKSLVSSLPDIVTPIGANSLQQVIGPESVDGAGLRALRNLLDKLDPKQYWGGLKKILTPEGHYLWLCEHHAKEYKR